MRDEQILLACCPILFYCWMAVVCACFALLVLFNLSLMTYIRAVRMLWTPLYFKHLCIIWTPLQNIDTSPYCGHLSIMNTIMHTINTSAYCGHLSIMNTICILWTPMPTTDTSYYGHLCLKVITTDTLAYSMDTFAYQGNLCIIQTPQHTTDNSTFYSLHLCIPWTPMHNMDTSTCYRHLCILKTTSMDSSLGIKKTKLNSYIIPTFMLQTPASFWCLYTKKRFDSTISHLLKSLVIIWKNMNVKDFLMATNRPFFSLWFVNLVVPDIISI